MRAHLLVGLAVMSALACLSSPGLPAWAASEPARSLDDELLESLGADPIDEFDRELFAPNDKKPGPRDARGKKPDAPGKDREELKRQLLRELGRAAESEEENPLAAIARRMREVEGRIAQTESGSKTQDLQNGIVANLDELIKQCRSCSKQCSGSKAGSKVSARRPVAQPKKKPGTAQGEQNPKTAGNPSGKPPGQGTPQRPDMDEMKDLIKSVWGELPETQREQMLEWMSEGEFLPKYELLIERYFRRLTESR
jgi:TolA-binding protein